MIAEALKKALLQAAIQGKLTKQLPEDGDARDLLKEIQKEKARLIKEGKLKKEKPLAEIKEDEIPFEIPENWVWVRLGDVTNYGIGKQVKPIDIPLNSWILELEDIEKNAFHVNSKRLDRIAGSNKNNFSINDVLYGKLRPYLKKVIIADDKGYCSTEIIPFNGYGFIHSKYLMYYLVAPSIDGYINNITHGMDMPRLGTDKARQLLLPVPPLAEQKRIVQKLERLLPEIEALQVEENKLDNLEKTFPSKIKASILQAAIQGKLTEQLPEDGDARDLLKEIQKEKARLIKEGKLKKEKPLPEIKEDETPFDIPDNWVWCRLGEMVQLVSGTSFGKNDTNEQDIRIIRGGNIDYTSNKLSLLDDDIYVSARLFDKEKEPITGDILIVGSTGSKKVIGKPAFVEQVYDKVQIGAFLRIIRPTFHLSSDYLKVIFRSEHYRQHIRDLAQGTNINNIRTSYLTDFLIPLPPLSEQKRIVDKLDELLPFCDSLE